MAEIMVGEQVINNVGEMGKIISVNKDYIQVQFGDRVARFLHDAFEKGFLVYKNAELQNKIDALLEQNKQEELRSDADNSEEEKPTIEMSEEEWQQLATTLKGYVWKDNIPQLDTGKTNANGTLTFPSEGVSMKPGLYLVLGDTRTNGYYTYYATPFLICLPGLNESGIQNQCHVTVVPKYRYDYDMPSDPSPSPITRKVMKVWNDEGYETLRPEIIYVYLLRDGQEYERTQLNYRNNWRHTWKGLERGYDWTVVEEHVDGYTVNVTQEGVTFVVTNTYQPGLPKDPNDPHTPTTPGQEIPEEYEEWFHVLGVTDESGNLMILPQTGQLWWPVPVLVCLGLVCMLISAICRRNAYEDE